MRYPASEKLEIIRLVEQSHLPVRRTLEKLGIQPARFYRWYDRLQTGGLEALEDKASRPTRVWNRIPDAIRERIVQLALDEPELSPRELATRFTDTANYFVSEASVYRLLKARDLITSPAYITLASDAEEPHPIGKLLPARRFESQYRQVRRSLQSSALSREPEQSNTGRRLLRARSNHPAGKRKDQTQHNPKTSLAASKESRLN